jgi:hypothetical protein
MCIGDDDLFSYRCWLRNADLDNRGITMTGERCIHECVCKEYREWYARFAAVVDEPCRDPSCQHDTRTRPHIQASKSGCDGCRKETEARAATLAMLDKIREYRGKDWSNVSWMDRWYLEEEYFNILREESLRAKPEQGKEG